MSVGPATFPWEAAIAARARSAGLDLSAESSSSLAAHARAVLAVNDRLHLTTVIEPAAFLERHIGESLEGAAMIPVDAAGVLVDLGSGNGYPGIPLAVARPGLVPVLVESSAKKAAFLREALAAAGRGDGSVLERHVARAADLDDVPPIGVLATRAMGGWERIIPKLAPRLAPEGIILIWGTVDSQAVAARAAWSKLRVVARRPIPGRERSIIFLVRSAGNS